MRVGAAALDRYERGRLLLVAGCVAAAATANVAGEALPQRAPVAVGAAALGVLLMLRRRPAEERRDDEATDASPPDVSLADLELRVDDHERRLTSLSGRQTLIDLHAREQLATLERRLHDLEEKVQRAEEESRSLRSQHLARLRDLSTALAEHRDELAALGTDGERG